MPLIAIRALPQRDGVDVDAALREVTHAVARAAIESGVGHERLDADYYERDELEEF